MQSKLNVMKTEVDYLDSSEYQKLENEINEIKEQTMWLRKKLKN